jgi:hypothetical protein
VNSSTERRILFSIWSPCHTDNPKDIPQDEKIKLVKKGKNVYSGLTEIPFVYFESFCIDAHRETGR